MGQVVDRSFGLSEYRGTGHVLLLRTPTFFYRLRNYGGDDIFSCEHGTLLSISNAPKCASARESSTVCRGCNSHFLRRGNTKNCEAVCHRLHERTREHTFVRFVVSADNALLRIKRIPLARKLGEIGDE